MPNHSIVMRSTKSSHGKLVAMACLLLVAFAIADARAKDFFQFGVCVHLGLNRNYLQETNDALSRLGVNSFRDEVIWNRVELQRDKLVYPANLKELDQLITQAVKSGKRPLLILAYGNLQHGGGMAKSADAINGFAEYARFVVKYFKGRVDQFEVWNEWNIGLGSGARAQHPGSPEAYEESAKSYANLLRAAYVAIKDENPSAVVIGGVMAAVDMPWVHALGRTDAFAHLDAFSVHPYEFWSKRTPTRPMPPVIDRLLSLSDVVAAETALVPITGTPEMAMARLDTLKAAVDQYAPGRDVPIYATEISWPTSTDMWGVAETTAANYAQRFFLLARTRPWLAGVWWYDLFDDGDNDKSKEERFGLFRHNRRPKPAAQSLIAIKDILLSPTVPSLSTEGGIVTVSGQLANGKPFKAAWLPTDNFSSKQEWPEADRLRSAGFTQIVTGGLSNASSTVSAVPLLFVKP